MSKWKEGGGMQPSGQTADGTNGATRSRLRLLIGPWWAFKRAPLPLTWHNAPRGSIISTSRQKSRWTTASLDERWIQFWWHLAAAMPVYHSNSIQPVGHNEKNPRRGVVTIGPPLGGSCRARRAAWEELLVSWMGLLPVFGQVHGLQTTLTVH